MAKTPAVPDAPQQRPGWQTGGATVLGFVAVLYVIEFIDQLGGGRLDADGIRPLQRDGLSGILFAPLLHGSWNHLFANTIPLLVLGFLMTLIGMGRCLAATAIIWLLGGLGTWLIGALPSCPNTVHIGASGLIFGWLTFLIVFGWWVRKPWQIVVGVLVALLYGSLLLGVVPDLNTCGGISWQGHLCGAIAGVVAAYLLSGPERTARAQKRPVQQ
ncbi:rhomboid family intramembrane serine protease [Mycolicibacterium insubricum]|jgi:membrane associated rhomboid family serine protease|uniref:Rhomboid family intramembrane serine protease n=1 Tax=Mycolicibacterium insubricum TaxID=444597 RepID=A0A1X0D0J4_9MYCO|nr:rhomboid family intramembrane serine protease [Mycolicibacterium insubricum]MCB0926815.1 rhomboid family intramembrane serine protease [Mycobacterium sp.]MCV7081075.1 rhomboid family intramembrane serine protease [Mycolicibacterium insubricum]ORA65926.1 rhomboid family intramembrane serine protease [Mycolicibacterium insubricum]BBZ68193.1 rhomboid family intramembrane serine protease [Mycolicibacterium insubricum]